MRPDDERRNIEAVTPRPCRVAQLSDEHLMRRVQVDDVAAFEELYRRYEARAFGVARVICGSSSLAEEATQDGFVSIWRSRDSYDPARGPARPWLLTVIRNRSIDVMRTGGRVDGLRGRAGELDYLQAPGSIADDTERHDEALRLRLALQTLPRCQREVIALVYFGGLTHTEVASRLGLPLGTVKGRIRLGLEKVRMTSRPGGSSGSGAAGLIVPQPSSGEVTLLGL